MGLKVKAYTDIHMKALSTTPFKIINLVYKNMIQSA